MLKCLKCLKCTKCIKRIKRIKSIKSIILRKYKYLYIKTTKIIAFKKKYIAFKKKKKGQRQNREMPRVPDVCLAAKRHPNTPTFR